ncbi:MAG TPA: hypothetical protein VM261_35755 [Kofleriaceae bacterium]|nr:hypothetical protein [Kofleriaceae bacterium]
MGWFVRHFDTWIAPIGLATVYAIFIWSSDSIPLVEVIAGMFFFALIGMWFWIRRLRLHAGASRLAAIGRPDELLALVAKELPRRLTQGTRAPMHVFAAMAHNLLGDHAAARAALDASGITLGERHNRSWQFLWAAADIHARTALGDIAGAKKSFEKGIAPMRPMATSGVELVALEAEARIKLAEGDAAGARELVAPMVKDVRLGPGARAQMHALLAQAADKSGDGEAAATHRAEARKLAPHAPLLAANAVAST